ncbi:MAG: DUF2271 domain-containing protein [Armatimonadetes bacterium]|nr:DUF2271 domain-containing protein [Armatimonadota bacterium]
MATAVLASSSALSWAFGKKKGPSFDSRFELSIDLEIASQEGFRVHRPYVAVYIEDAQGRPVRTIGLWVQTSRRGPRWIPDLRRWFRGESSRKEADGGDLVQTVSSATREAGKYNLVWDGKNDKGKAVEQGEYTVYIEAAREHGTYQLISKTVKIGTKAFKEKLTGNIEIKEASLEFRKRK